MGECRTRLGNYEGGVDDEIRLLKNKVGISPQHIWSIFLFKPWSYRTFLRLFPGVVIQDIEIFVCIRSRFFQVSSHEYQILCDYLQLLFTENHAKRESCCTTTTLWEKNLDKYHDCPPNPVSSNPWHSYQRWWPQGNFTTYGRQGICTSFLRWICGLCGCTVCQAIHDLGEVLVSPGWKLLRTHFTVAERALYRFSVLEMGSGLWLGLLCLLFATGPKCRHKWDVRHGGASGIGSKEIFW